MFKKKANIIEKNPEKLRRVLLKSTFAQDESYSLLSLSKDQMLHARKRKLEEEKR